MPSMTSFIRLLCFQCPCLHLPLMDTTTFSTLSNVETFSRYFFVLFRLIFRVAINFLNTLSKYLHLGLTIKMYPNIMYCINPRIWHKNERAAIFCTTTPTSVPHHLPAMKSFMTCPLMEFCHYSDVTQNLPQSLFPVTMLQTECILPLLLIVHCISS